MSLNEWFFQSNRQTGRLNEKWKPKALPGIHSESAAIIQPWKEQWCKKYLLRFRVLANIFEVPMRRNRGWCLPDKKLDQEWISSHLWSINWADKGIFEMVDLTSVRFWYFVPFKTQNSQPNPRSPSQQCSFIPRAYNTSKYLAPTCCPESYNLSPFKPRIGNYLDHIFLLKALNITNWKGNSHFL